MAIPDFTFKQQVPSSAILDAIANKPIREAQLRAAEQERQQGKINQIRQVAQDTSNLVQSFVQSSKERQRREAIRDMASLFVSGAPQSQIQAKAFEAYPQEAGKAYIENQLFPSTPTGTPPRTVEGIYVDQFNRGQIDEPTLKNKLQEVSPEVSVVKDSEGRSGIYDRRTRAWTPLFNQNQPGPGGKSKAQEFTPVEREAIEKSKTQFNSDPVVKDLSQSLTAVTRAKVLLDKNPKGAGGMIKTMLAKMVENNRLSDQDIQRISGSSAVADRLIRAKSDILEGRLSDVDRKDFLNIINLMETASAEEFDAIINDTVESLSFDVSNANPEALRKKLAGGELQKIKRALNRKINIENGSIVNTIPKVGETFNGGKVLTIERVE